MTAPSPVPRPPTVSIEAELDLALDALATRPEIYRPTSFWEEASRRLAEELRREGIGTFRRQPLPLVYFVPTYGSPGNRISRESAAAARDVIQGDSLEKAAFERFVSGRDAAFADFRVLSAADDARIEPRLDAFSESEVGSPHEQFTFDGRRFSRSALGYLLGLAFLKGHLGEEKIRSVLEIGGGFGTLGEILVSADPSVRYIDLDIPPGSVVAQYYLSEVFGADKVTTFRQTATERSIDIERLSPLSALCNWQIENLNGEIDLFVNFISFQEMEPDVVANYLEHVTRLRPRWVLLRNMREGKQIRTENSFGVLEPIVSDDYPRMLPEHELVATNVVPFGEIKIDGYHSELMLFRHHTR